MLDVKKFIAELKKYELSGIDYVVMKKAYEFGKKAHTGQLRKSGEPYFTHPIAVCFILAELEMDQDTLVAALLHDVIEDTPVSYEEIAEQFGKIVANLVDGVTKLDKIHYETREEREADNVRKMVLAMAEDIRVILIKLADRLHNIRTLKFQTDDKKIIKARETLEIYAPIAHRLGIFKIKWELEDISLLYLDPEGYYDLVAKINKKRSAREDFINSVIAKLRNELNEMNIDAEIYGRPKNFYSIYKKMKFQHKNFDEIFDITAVRIIVDNVKDCYGVLGIVHTLWKPIQGRFKDYIAMPKTNMYQSLHTTLISDIGDPFEVQIRTEEMHRVAEYGIAAHWKYKEGNDSASKLDQKLAWLRQSMELHKEIEKPEEFVESLKMDIFTHMVYVFTPKGRVIELPAGSTPVDFAYKIHSGVGNSCIGAKVDGRIVPLNYVLDNGKIVEIITSKNASGPSRDWLKFVQSSGAKNKIKRWFKKERREENIEKGREMIEREIRRNGFSMNDFQRPEWLEIILGKLTVKNLDDLYAAVGYGGILTSQVIPKMRELYREEKKKKEQNQELEVTQSNYRSSSVSHKRSSSNHGIIVDGIDDTTIRFARCCNPLPGDHIIGFITRGRGITIHRSDCTNLETTEEVRARFIEVRWADSDDASYEAEIQIISPDRKNLLADATGIVSDMDVLVNGVAAKRSKDGMVMINIKIEIKGIEQLKKIMNKYKAMPDVIDVKRVTN